MRARISLDHLIEPRLTDDLLTPQQSIRDLEAAVEQCMSEATYEKTAPELRLTPEDGDICRPSSNETNLLLKNENDQHLYPLLAVRVRSYRNNDKDIRRKRSPIEKREKIYGCVCARGNRHSFKI